MSEELSDARCDELLHRHFTKNGSAPEESTRDNIRVVELLNWYRNMIRVGYAQGVLDGLYCALKESER